MRVISSIVLGLIGTTAAHALEARSHEPRTFAAPAMTITIDAATHWRIDEVQADPTSDGHLYTVSIVDAQGDRPLCPGNDGMNKSALPLEGRWDAAGQWHPDSLTFACHDGVLAKCVRWGYAPWAEHDGQSLRAHHQACTRMARADYCGDGVPHTQNGTLINLWDNLGIQASEPGPELAFEAAWTPDGAFNIERTRYPEEMAYVIEHCPDRLAGGAVTGKALFWNESVPR